MDKTITRAALLAGALVLAAPSAASAETIAEIQGAAHVSPLVGDPVSRVQGVVTATRSNGFYLQSPTPDSDPASSEGLFVFTGAAPTVRVRDRVRVSGTVSEFRPGGSGGTNNLSITQIASPSSVTVQARGVRLPDLTTVGAGGRVQPSEVIDDDADGSVETSGSFDEATDGIDFYESLEGMRLRVPDAVAVGPTNRFGEVTVVADLGAAATQRTPRGGLFVSPTDFNPERIQIDDTIAATGQVDVGDRVGSPTGVLDYSFGNFELLTTAPLVRTDGGLEREVTTAPAAGELTVASFNVENLDPADPPAKIAALASQVVDNLLAPDVIGVEEVQDNNGAVNDSVVDGSQSAQALIDAIVAEGGPTYEYAEVDPIDDTNGGEPGGNIRVGFLYRSDRGLDFVEREGGSSTSSVAVTGTGDGTRLSASPGLVDPTNAAFNSSRKPLAGEFTYRGETLFVIANHFNSKGGDQPLFGRFQPPARSSEVQRREQAAIVNDFADDLLAADPDAKVAIVGDLNDFEFSEVLDIVKGDGEFTNLVETLPANERYTFNFEGNSQTLDHVLVSDALTDGATYDQVHVNTEFADKATDHDPSVARLGGIGTPAP